MAESHDRNARNSRPPEPLRQRQRQQRIRSMVESQGFMRIQDLMSELSVSAMTIHRDLEELQREGWLRKVHGGATTQPSSVYHGDYRHRLSSMKTAKRRLCEAALELVHPKQAILLDESTTVLQMIGGMTARAPLTVVTNSFGAIQLLVGQSDVELIALGGRFYPAYNAFLGIQTVTTVNSLRVDYAFLSTTAITGGACYHLSQETVAVKQAFLKVAEYKVLLVDHTKFQYQALHQLARLEEFDLILVDSGAPTACIEEVRRNGGTVQVVSVD